ncbi:MAG: hypothetical protein KKI02_08885, partial [Planctomycetes bacterium]|nr:hypothetical protein [Planctomycetota bacterium]
RLCRRLCRHCARPAGDPAAILALLPQNTADALAASYERGPAGDVLMQPMGCKRCGSTGYDGRIGIFEVLVVNDELRRAIMARKDERTLVDLARENGMRLLIEDGLIKVRNGLTTVQELLRVAGHVDVGANWAAELYPPDDDTDPAGEQDQDSSLTRAGRPCDASRVSEFDVSGYEALLGRWLQTASQAGGQPVPIGAGAGPGSEN